ncbi:hypothetical protein [Vibrio cholerae]|uniref:hypothetical protein n=1 Tax=Vibrio cholerae TaxID=666 RepID=UPI0011576E1B|nr:hypothetical protein [Vibrio cholerae]EKF9450829.1 hypothetical protein [Vibrio cholerae]TQQ74484.1 hypothetical protein FLL60_08270 [Vibrio cholerae]GFK33121.1 hypothetical protein VcPa01_01231 [Vibrio cholerae]GFK36715.1 hypothetical protein VcPa02_01276 [Vibrio cholerae]GFK40454.1 hypothetical protein VcPa03_01523 [Vibrio cholerae]
MSISTRDVAGAQAAAEAAWAADDALKTTEVGTAFEALVAFADNAVEEFIAGKATEEGGLQLSAGESLQLQRLMGDQSITVQTGTSTLKSIKDSITSAARNI